MKPFIAFATQNPLNIEGITPLPKVLADRFLMRIAVNYPSNDEEQEMLRIKETESTAKTEKVMGIKEILGFQDAVKDIKILRRGRIADNKAGRPDARRHTRCHGRKPEGRDSLHAVRQGQGSVEGRSEVTMDDINSSPSRC